MLIESKYHLTKSTFSVLLKEHYRASALLIFGTSMAQDQRWLLSHLYLDMRRSIMENNKIAIEEMPVERYFRSVVKPALKNHARHPECIERIQEIGNKYLMCVLSGEDNLLSRMRFEDEIGNFCMPWHCCMGLAGSNKRVIFNGLIPKRKVALGRPSAHLKLRKKPGTPKHPPFGKTS
jgi:hypothetical protein